MHDAAAPGGRQGVGERVQVAGRRLVMNSTSLSYVLSFQRDAGQRMYSRTACTVVSHLSFVCHERAARSI